jgi:hypothetical protein
MSKQNDAFSLSHPRVKHLSLLPWLSLFTCSPFTSLLQDLTPLNSFTVLHKCPLPKALPSPQSTIIRASGHWLGTDKYVVSVIYPRMAGAGGRRQRVSAHSFICPTNQGYVTTCAGNLTEEKSRVSMSEFPIGVWIQEVMLKIKSSNTVMLT